MRGVGGGTGMAVGALAACSFVLAALGGAAAPAEATPPGTNGKIAFQSVNGGADPNYGDIFVMNPDGSALTNLTNNAAEDGSPNWSPDGTKIAFQTNRDGGSYATYVMNADGSSPTRVMADASEPSWSPDGTRIAFSTIRDGNLEIYAMNANGSSPTRLTNNPASDNVPVWSPDGTKIAFQSSRDHASSEIYVMNSDGTGVTRLTTNTAIEGNPDWSPDGSKIAFQTTRDGGATEIYSMSSDGSSPARLTNHAAADNAPTWSPDGTKIAFYSFRSGTDHEIYVMDADGANVTAALTSNAVLDSFPAWQPIPLPPSVTALTPASGTTAGGTTVTIAGSRFTGATAVSFGGTAAASFTVNGATQITAVAPAQAAGTVGVRVTTPGGTSADTAADDFAYLAPSPSPSPTPPPTESSPPSNSADLGVALSGSPVLAPGGSGIFTVSVTNEGPFTATSVRVSITLPAQLTLDSATSSAGQCTGTAPVSCELNSLGSGFAGTIELAVSANGNGEGTLTAGIGGAEPDPDTSNQAASILVSVGCARSFTLDTVSVTAECIALEGQVLTARGDVRLGNGARIVTAGTQDSAPLVIDAAAHTIRLAPLDGGGARSGVLVAGTREVVAGPLVIHTPATGDPNSGLKGLAWVEGASDLRVKLSSWSFLNSAADTLVYLVPSGADGGALVVGRLTFPFYVKNYEGLLSLQVRSNGSRTMRAGTIRIGEFLLPGTPFQMKEAELAFLDGGDTFRGKGIFGSQKLLGELIVDPVLVTNGKLHDFRAVYDGTGCEKCGPKDPGLAPPPKSGEKPSPGKIVIRLVYAELNGINLQSIKYEPPVAGSALGPKQFCTKSCPAPPEVNGKVVVSALDNKVVGIGQFRYKLSGRLTMDGKIFFAPAMPSSFKFPAFAQGAAPYADFLKHAVEFAEAHAVFDPPMFWVDGSWRVDQTGFIRANFGLGFDPPHFTGEGGVEFRVPENSPIFPGKSLGGAQGLVSDKAGAGQATFRVCAPKWLGGGCIRYFVGAALLWHSLNFQFGHNVDDYRTVGNSTVMALGERGVVRSAVDSFIVAPGVEFAAIRLRGAQGVPDVRLESPAVGGNRLSLTLGGSDDPGNATGALAYAVPDRNEVVFVVAKPPAGTWRIDTRGGVAVTAVELGRGLPDPELSPTSGLPTKASTSVELRWATTNPGQGATVDLWAERTGEASVLIAAEQPATGATAWRLDRVPAGNYTVKATLSRDGVPLQTRFWPGVVGVTDVEGPPAPARAVAIAAAPGAHVRWTPAARAEAYRVVARPVPASAGEVVELGVQASELQTAVALTPGLRYTVAVQTVDRNSRRSPEIAAGIVEVTGAAAPPLLAGEPANAQIGAPWGFAPIVENLAGGAVTLRLVRGPRGMRVRGKDVLWTPRTQGRHAFVLEARNEAGQARRRTFEALVAPRGMALAAPARGIAVRPTSVIARRATTLTLAAGRIGAATVLLDGRRVASRRIDAETRRITVRCLRAGVHRLEIRRADGTRAMLRRAFTVVGPGC